MKLLRTIILLCLLTGCILPVHAQYFDISGNRKHLTIPFRLIRNMVIIQLKINNSGPFNFVLDTGVGMMIITEPKLIDSIKIPSKRLIKITGMGMGDDDEAYITSALQVDIHGLTSYDVSAAMLEKDHFNLSSYAGIPIHGLLGYEFFNSLAVKLNFGDTTLTVCRPKYLHPRGTKIPLVIQERKPYLQAWVTYPNGKRVDSKLVIDIGAGHPLSLENMIKNNGLPSKYISANLGVGLNGPIEGFISRIKEIDIGKYKIHDVITSFPDDSKRQIIPLVPRDGNLGIGILKKFDVTFDYQDNAMYLKPGFHYNEPYEHDMSGLEYYATGDDYHHIIISRVEPGSAGYETGLEKGDEIMAINFKNVEEMSLEEIDGIFKSRDGRSLLLEIFHDNKYDNVILTLKRRI